MVTDDGSFAWPPGVDITGAVTSVTATSPVSSSGGATPNISIANNAISNAKLAQMAAHTYKGNNTGSTANAADITSTQLTADLNLFTSLLQGLTPSSGGGTTNFLRADGTWADPGASSGSTPAPRFTLSGATVPFVCIDGCYYVSTTNTLASVNIAMLNSGASGSTAIQVNQYRSGALHASATASLAASGGSPSGSNEALSGSLSLLSGDILTIDINSVASGAPSDLSVMPVLT